MSANQTFEAMRGVIESPGYPYLKHYRQDFYEHDRRFIERNHSTDASYLWIVRESGTHLIALGVHPKMCEEGFAAMRLSGACDLYLVKRERVKSVGFEEAERLLREFRYRVDGASVVNAQGVLAGFTVSMSPWHAGSVKGTVRYTTGASSRSLSLGDLIALAQIAECEVIRSTQSLFTPTELILLDGADLRDLIEQRRQDTPAAPRACVGDPALTW